MRCEFNVIPGGISNFNWATTSNKLLLLYSQSGEVDEDRFAEFIEVMKTYRPAYLFSLGTGMVKLTSLQRKAAADVSKKLDLKVSVVVDNTITRGILTALNWLGVGIKGFGPGEVREAITYLDVPGVTADEIIRAFERLREASLPNNRKVANG